MQPDLVNTDSVFFFVTRARNLKRDTIINCVKGNGVQVSLLKDRGYKFEKRFKEFTNHYPNGKTKVVPCIYLCVYDDDTSNMSSIRRRTESIMERR